MSGDRNHRDAWVAHIFPGVILGLYPILGHRDPFRPWADTHVPIVTKGNHQLKGVFKKSGKQEPTAVFMWHEEICPNYSPATEFNIVRLWRLTGGYLKRILEMLARRPPQGRHLLCYFQVQTFEAPDLWKARGTEVPAEHRHAELARSPLRQYGRLIHKWGLSPGGPAHSLRVSFR